MTLLWLVGALQAPEARGLWSLLEAQLLQGTKLRALHFCSGFEGYISTNPYTGQNPRKPLYQ